MSRYYFAVCDDLDDIGTDFASDEAARAEALRSSGTMIHDIREASLWNGQDWTMRVTDQDGREVAMLRLSGTRAFSDQFVS